jgi:uncharacterized RDD family membrane protein YckC
VILEKREVLVGERLPRRLAAGLIDTAVLAAASTALIVAAAHAGPWRGLVTAFAIALWIGYFIAFEALAGATPGKRLCGLCVRDDEGQRAPAVAHVIRAFTRLPEAVMLLPYLVLIHGSPRHQRLGDVLANALVMRCPQPH